MEPSILRFILFIGAEILFMIASYLASVVTLGNLIARSGELKNSYASVIILVASMVGAGFMMLFSFVLTGNSHYVPFLIILVASLATVSLVEFFWLMFGSTNVPWFGRAVWAGFEFQRIHPKVQMFVQLFSIAILIAFPLYVGMGYFGDIFASADWPKYVMKAIIVVFIGASMLAQLPARLYLMVSRNLMEGTRLRLFMSQLANAASLLLLASLFVWTTNTEGTTVSLLGEFFVFSSTIAWAIAVYLVLIVVVPYLIGHFRSKHWIELLADNCGAILSHARKALDSPNLSKVDEALKAVQDEIEQTLETINKDPSLVLAYKVQESVDDESYVLRLGLGSSVDRDPRFIQVNQLLEILGLIADCRAEVKEKDADEDKRKILGAYANSLQHYGNELAISETGKPWGVLLVTTLVGSVLTPVMASIGKVAAARLGLPTG